MPLTVNAYTVIGGGGGGGCFGGRGPVVFCKFCCAGLTAFGRTGIGGNIAAGSYTRNLPHCGRMFVRIDYVCTARRTYV